MYSVKEELVEDLKGGRTLKYIAEMLGITQQYVSLLFSNKRSCTKILAKNLIGLRFNLAINDIRMEELLEKYFDKI